MRLSVIVVNWNTRGLLRQCLASLRDPSGASPHQVFVVDNASVDGSREMVKAEFPDVLLVENSVNVGFPRANNQVIPRCTGQYLLFLNPDAAVAEGALEKMMSFLDSNPAYGAVGPRVLRPDGAVQMECACGFPTLARMFFELTRLSALFPQSPVFGSWRMTHWDHMDSRDIECLLGAAILMRRSILEDIGYLDEHMYIEDDDLCYRIIEAGWKIRYMSDAVVVHHDGASRKKSPRFYHHYQLAWHGIWHFFRKHRGRSHAFIFRAMTFACSLAGVSIFYPASWLCAPSRGLSSRLREKGRKSLSVFLWSVTPAKGFSPRY